MSNYGETRRVTRASSQAASVISHASSVEKGTQLDTSTRRTRRTTRQSTTPAEQSEAGTKNQRAAAREAAAMDEPNVEPKTKKQGNKRNVGYGAKGKRLNPVQMSAEATADNPAQHIQGSIDNSIKLPTRGAAGQLPVLTEEQRESVLPSIEDQQQDDRTLQWLSGTPNPVQSQIDEQLRANMEAQARESRRQSRQGSVHPNAGDPSQSNAPGQGNAQDNGHVHPNVQDFIVQGETQTDATGLGGQSWISTAYRAIRSRLLWAPAEEPDLPEDYFSYHRIEERRQHFRLRAVMEEHVREIVDDEIQGRNIPRDVFWLTTLCYIGFGLALSQAIAAILLGRDLGCVANQSRLHRTGNRTMALLDAQYYRNVQKSHARLDKLESFVHSLVSPTSTSPPPPPKPTHEVNWFAAANGAIADPYLSSPVDLKCWGIREHTWYTKLMSIGGKCESASYPPGQALRPWSEPDQRWCAPPGRGKLQLTILTPRPIAPTDLVLEHMPKDASLRIGDAPKEIELWVDIPNPEVNARIREGVGYMFPNILFNSSPQDDRELDEAQALPDSFVPVGRWMYNIYKDDHVQRFNIPLPLRDFGVKATRFALRVNSNWGDLHSTCIHRARLHGQDVSGIVEHLEEEPKEE